jgi:predicted TIM-barrel fold metal-dependent hydrolase
MPGIRLHPNYHGYALEDPRFAQLLESAAMRGLFVQLVTQLDATPRPLLTPRARQVDLTPLPKILESLQSLRLLIANLVPTQMEPVAALDSHTRACLEFSETTDVKTLRQTIKRVPAERLVYGSCAPLHGHALRQNTLQQLDLSTTQLKAVRSGNAEQLRSKREPR